jgi:hypothetical protein
VRVIDRFLMWLSHLMDDDRLGIAGLLVIIIVLCILYRL